MQRVLGETTLDDLMKVSGIQWSSALADTHQRSAKALHAHPSMLKLRDKSHRLCSEKHDSEALIATDLNGRWDGDLVPVNTGVEAKISHPFREAKLPLETLVLPDNKSVRDGWQKQSLLAGCCRILSICAENSVSPFGIKEETMIEILQNYSIPVTFLDIILAFGQKPGNGVAGMAQATLRQRLESDFDIQYLLTYVELAEGARESDIRYWTTRQVGLYQRYSRDNDCGFCVLLQPQKQSVAQRSVDHLKTNHGEQPRSCIASLLDVHLIILSSYFHNWQSFLTVLNNNFEDIAKLVLTIQWTDMRDYENGQEQMQRLHHLQDCVFVVSPRLRATLEILGTLEALEGVDILHEAESKSENTHYRRQFLYELRTYKTLTNGLLESASSLERRMEGILTMLSAALNLRHQATGVDISGGVLRLTNDIVSDSTAVRVVTFATLLYMPATFIATVLGTNLFTYSNPGTNAGFHVSPQFWIFVVLAIPLTLITIGCWFFYNQRTKNSRLKKVEDQQSNKLWAIGTKWLITLVRTGFDSRRPLVKNRATRSTESDSFVGP